MARRNLNAARHFFPIWTTAQTATVNLAFMALLEWMGVRDIPSYFRQLRIPVAISVFLCAWYGAATYGIPGFVIGGLLGLSAPAALLFLAVLLVGVFIFLAIYAIAMAAVFYVLWWFLTGLVGR